MRSRLFIFKRKYILHITLLLFLAFILSLYLFGPKNNLIALADSGSTKYQTIDDLGDWTHFGSIIFDTLVAHQADTEAPMAVGKRIHYFDTIGGFDIGDSITEANAVMGYYENDDLKYPSLLFGGDNASRTDTEDGPKNSIYFGNNLNSNSEKKPSYWYNVYGGDIVMYNSMAARNLSLAGSRTGAITTANPRYGSYKGSMISVNEDSLLISSWFDYWYQYIKGAQSQYIEAAATSNNVVKLQDFVANPSTGGGNKWWYGNSSNSANHNLDNYKNTVLSMPNESSADGKTLIINVDCSGYTSWNFDTVWWGTSKTQGSMQIPAKILSQKDTNGNYVYDLVVFNFVGLVNVQFGSVPQNLIDSVFGGNLNKYWKNLSSAEKVERIATCSNIVYNFPDAKTITHTSGFVSGAVVAPDATYYASGGSINGQLVVQNYTTTNGNEIHALSVTPKVYELTNNTEPEGSVEIVKYLKYDEATENIRIGDADFILWRSEGGVKEYYIGNGEFTSNENLAMIYTASREQAAFIDGLPYGTYVIEEKKTPKGYKLNTVNSLDTDTYYRYEIEISSENEQITISRFNEPMTWDVHFEKRSDGDDTPLAGAKFKLIRLADDFYPEDKIVGTTVGKNSELIEGLFVSDENGSIILPNLTVGKYILREIEPPTGYSFVKSEHEEWETGEYHFRIRNIPDEFGNSKVYIHKGHDDDGYLNPELEMNNINGGEPAYIYNTHKAPNYALSIYKYDSDSHEHPLSGAIFELYKKEDNGNWSQVINNKGESEGGIHGEYGAILSENIVDLPDGQIKIGNSGYYYFPYISPGVYRLIEVETPDGYTVINQYEDLTWEYGPYVKEFTVGNSEQLTSDNIINLEASEDLSDISINDQTDDADYLDHDGITDQVSENDDIVEPGEENVHNKNQTPKSIFEEDEIAGINTDLFDETADLNEDIIDDSLIDPIDHTEDPNMVLNDLADDVVSFTDDSQSTENTTDIVIVEIANKEIKGKVILEKWGDVADDIELIDQASFRVERKNPNIDETVDDPYNEEVVPFLLSYTLGGRLELGELEPGSYRIIERIAPQGYIGLNGLLGLGADCIYFDLKENKATGSVELTSLYLEYGDGSTECIVIDKPDTDLNVDTPLSYSVDDDGTIHIKVYNTAVKALLRVYKADSKIVQTPNEEGGYDTIIEYLENAAFIVQRQEYGYHGNWDTYGGKFVSVKKDDNDDDFDEEVWVDDYGNYVAIAEFDTELIYGNYRIVEIDPPEGYTVVDNSRSVLASYSLEPEENTETVEGFIVRNFTVTEDIDRIDEDVTDYVESFFVPNQKETANGKIKIRKLDSQNNPVAGIPFRLWEISGGSSESWGADISLETVLSEFTDLNFEKYYFDEEKLMTDVNGYIELNNVTPGVYALFEVWNDDYQSNNDSFLRNYLYFLSHQSTMLDYANPEFYYHITAFKVVAVDESNIDAGTKVEWVHREKVWTGEAELSDDGSDITITIYNILRSELPVGISFLKTDEEGDVLQGAIFELYERTQYTDGSINDYTSLGTAMSNAEGEVTFMNLDAKWRWNTDTNGNALGDIVHEDYRVHEDVGMWTEYLIKEKEAPPGYKLSDEELHFMLWANPLTKALDLILLDYSDDSVKFPEAYESSIAINTAYEQVQRLMGKIPFSVNSSYVPALNWWLQNFTRPSNNEDIMGKFTEIYQLGNIENYLNLYDLELTKIDLLDESKTLTGAQFYLYSGSPHMENNDWNKEDLIAVEMSGADGKVKFTKLEPGNYFLVENKAPEGYELAQGYWIIQISFNGETDIEYHSNKNELEQLISTSESGEWYIKNRESMELPLLGGGGNWPYWLSGMIFILVSFCIVMANMRYRLKH